MKFLSSEGCVINTSSRGCGSEMKNEESNFQITLKWFCDMLVFIALVFLSCLSLSGWVHAAKTKKCFGCSEARNEPQQSFQNPQKNIHWEIIRVDFYHRDNGDVVCLSEITLSVKDSSSCFLCLLNPEGINSITQIVFPTILVYLWPTYQRIYQRIHSDNY